MTLPHGRGMSTDPIYHQLARMPQDPDLFGAESPESPGFQLGLQEGVVVAHWQSCTESTSSHGKTVFCIVLSRLVRSYGRTSQRRKSGRAMRKVKQIFELVLVCI